MRSNKLYALDILIMTMIDREFCYRLNKNVELLVERFAEKYWEDMPTITCLEEESDMLKTNYTFNDEMHFNTDEMYTALWYNIPKAILFAWWDIQCWNVSWVKMSLLNFYTYHRDGVINEAKQ